MDEPGLTEDRLLGGAVRLLQVRQGHRAGTDAVLLAALAPVRAGDRVVDLGAASGAVGLMVACRVAVARLTFVDRDPALLALCRRNAGLNGIDDRSACVEGDLLSRHLPDGVAAGSADLVVTNPPFLDHGMPASPDPGRRAAHVIDEGGLAAWLANAGRWLRHRGRLALIHRAEAMPLCLVALRPAFGSLDLVPIHPRAEAAATRIVIRAVRGGRAPLRLRPGLVLHGEDGRFTPEAAALHAAPA